MANILISAFMWATTFASPIPNGSTGNSLISGPKPVFQSDPTGRGTIGLVFSCSATFIICIWTSVHADIPPLHCTCLIRFKYKAVWMVVAALIPEGLIMCAFGQWHEARKIRKVWKEKFETELSMEEAFFVVMSGFTIAEFADRKGEEAPVYYTSTLTASGFKEYVKEGRISSDAFEKRHIVDKGKGSTLAKSIACLQVVWLVVQCIARKLSQLPLTLLELHVAIQVGCTIITYGLWWNKPLDVEQPILLILKNPPVLETPSSKSVSSQKDGLLSSPPPENFKAAKLHYKECAEVRKIENDKGRKPCYITRLGPPQCLPTLALAFYDIVHYMDTGFLMMLVESILTIPIGALHAIAWNLHFPTPLESWMWRISSIIISTCPVGIVFTAYFGNYLVILVVLTLEMSFVVPGRFKNLHTFLWSVVSKISAVVKSKDRGVLHGAGVSWALLLIALYGVAVAFITVESYISIRSPPEGSFETPKWTNFVPHL